MSSLQEVKFIQRGTSTAIAAQGGQNGDQNVSQFLPAYAQLNAAGKVFGFDMSGGTAIVCVVAMPTTSPEWGIYNAHATARLVLLRVAAILASGTTGLGLTIVCAAAKGAQTAVTSNYSGAIVSCLDGSSSTPDAYITNNPALVGGTPAWVPFATTAFVANGPVGKGIVANVDGLISVAPRGLIGIEFVGPVGGQSLYDCFAVCALIDMDTA